MTLPISEAGRRYGYIRDIPDARDRGMLRVHYSAPRVAPLPSKISHLKDCGPIKDQSNEGSCTGHAGTEHREFEIRHYSKYEKHLDGADPHSIVFSPQNLYWREREKEGTVNEDAGAQMRTIVQVLNKYGVCRESSEPYDTSKFKVPPTPEQTAEAYNFRSGPYHRLNTVDDMKGCLAYGSEQQQYTFVLGFAVWSSFEGHQVARDGLMPVPDTETEIPLGGHAVHVIGYDDSVKCPGARFRGALEIQNSWGKGWGQGGRFWMPYEVAANPQLVFDCWMTHLGYAW